MTFREKCFSCHKLLTDQISLSDCLLLEMLGNMCITTVCQQDCEVTYFEVNLIPYSQDEKLNILRTERAFEVKQKAFIYSFIHL